MSDEKQMTLADVSPMVACLLTGRYRDVTTDAGQSRNYRKRVVVIGEAPAPAKK